jgi:hypothetical protein
MAQQIINIGSSPNDRSGDHLRTAFGKINSNFTELYSGSNNSIESNTVFDSANTIFSTATWISGSSVDINVSEYETRTLITFNTAENSPYIYFKWDLDFIENVWNGNGDGYEVSLDSGDTWIKVSNSGYSWNTSFYFYVEDEVIGQEDYLFTYSVDQEVLIRFNRGSIPAVFFDLTESPYPIDKIFAVDMSIVFKATINDSIAYTYRPNVYFVNDLNDDIDTNSEIEKGSAFVYNRLRSPFKKVDDPEDAHRVYINFWNGEQGTITSYWHAKLYMIED